MKVQIVPYADCYVKVSLWFVVSVCIMEVALDYSRKYGVHQMRVLTLEKNRGKGGAVRLVCCFNPLTPMSDQDRISPYNINTMSTR